jgi:hypothetical protein
VPGLGNRRELTVRKVPHHHAHLSGGSDQVCLAANE